MQLFVSVAFRSAHHRCSVLPKILKRACCRGFALVNPSLRKTSGNVSPSSILANSAVIDSLPATCLRPSLRTSRTPTRLGTAHLSASARSIARVLPSELSSYRRRVSYPRHTDKPSQTARQVPSARLRVRHGRAPSCFSSRYQTEENLP